MTTTHLGISQDHIWAQFVTLRLLTHRVSRVVRWGAFKEENDAFLIVSSMDAIRYGSRERSSQFII